MFGKIAFKMDGGKWGWKFAKSQVRQRVKSDYREVNLYKRTELIKMVNIPYDNFNAPFDKWILYIGKQKM